MRIFLFSFFVLELRHHIQSWSYVGVSAALGISVLDVCGSYFLNVRFPGRRVDAQFKCCLYLFFRWGNYVYSLLTCTTK